MSLKALRDTKTQTWPPRPTFTEANIPPGSQNGRVFIVTGGNTGIGFELCKILYATGATIYMASRTKAKAEAAIKAITETATKSKSTNGKIKFVQLDLNDLLSVQAAAATFASQESKLDVLWNNAGTGPKMLKKGQRTVQGFEPMIGMHCIATLLFTELLLPQLRAAAVADGKSGRTRVVWTSSPAAESFSPPNGIDFDVLDTGSTDDYQNYGASKAATWILGREFARRYGKDGIISVVQNPGQLKAGSYEGMPGLVMFFLNAFVLHDPVFGAYTELYSGLSDEIGVGDSGVYVIPWGRIRSLEATPRKDLVQALKTVEEGGLGYGEKFWEWCEEQWKKFV